MSIDEAMSESREQARGVGATANLGDGGMNAALHDLNNVFVSILLNAQVIEWKLPSYSRIRRNVHEVERSAQRGGLLVKRILQQLEASEARQMALPAKSGKQKSDTGPGT